MRNESDKPVKADINEKPVGSGALLGPFIGFVVVMPKGFYCGVRVPSGFDPSNHLHAKAKRISMDEVEECMGQLLKLRASGRNPPTLHECIPTGHRNDEMPTPQP